MAFNDRKYPSLNNALSRSKRIIVTIVGMASKRLKDFDSPLVYGEELYPEAE